MSCPSLVIRTVYVKSQFFSSGLEASDMCSDSTRTRIPRVRASEVVDMGRAVYSRIGPRAVGKNARPGPGGAHRPALDGARNRPPPSPGGGSLSATSLFQKTILHPCETLCERIRLTPLLKVLATLSGLPCMEFPGALTRRPDSGDRVPRQNKATAGGRNGRGAAPERSDGQLGRDRDSLYDNVAQACGEGVI